MRDDARLEAQKQWNAIACGELEGEKGTTQYFEQVERDRYRQQPWMVDYFGFNRFAGKKVLEIGVGQGTDLMQFAKGGAECYGVDITENHLTLTQRNFELRGKRVRLWRADATRLPFQDDCFDCVYSFGVLHHIPEIEQVLGEAQRVLRPGGELMIAVYHKWSAFHIFWKLMANGIRNGWLFSKGYKGLLATIEKGADGTQTKPYVRLFSRKSTKNLLAMFTIEDISVYQLDADHFWPAFIARRMARHVTRLEPHLGWYVVSKARKREV